ncbi:ABC transporter substrate-binding protein [Leucobacter chromiisoli]|uniref:ABC transporter substrate-binding protein n=1 Tax=Leucobacter chromiisoli TaxID=2796471 RepID=UPI0027DB1A76|nr:ABC transporter substrate-binding protein [Leucobacter chromiisoli]
MKRTLTKTSLALVAVAGLALAGCATGSRGGAGGGEDGGGELLTTTPAPAGEIDYANWNLPYGEPASIDPIKGFNYPENQVTANICDTIVQMQPDLSIAPNLASEWEEQDPQTYVFTIRDDVTFWDGSPMTMEDVLYSVNRNLDPAEGSYWAGSAANIASVEQTGDWEMTITLKEPDATFVEVLGTPIGAVVQQKQRVEAGQDFGNPGGGVMCTGPFKVKEWKQGQSILLERNDDYWNEDRKAKAKEFEIDFVVDPTAIGNSLSTGEILGGYDLPLPALSQLAGSSSGQLYSGKGMQLMGIIAQGDGPFADPIVRRAITRATDRQAIVDTVYEGTAVPARSIVPELNWEPTPEVEELREERLPDLSFDIEAAKQELEESDADLSQTIKIAYPSERSFYADIINEMANGAAELGLKLEPAGVPSAQFGAFFTDPEARKGYDGFVTINYPSSPSPINYISGIAGTGGDQNFNEFSDPEVDAAIEAARTEPDPEKRAELSVEAEALMMESMPWVPVAQLNVRLFMDDSITGVPASFVYLNYPWAADLGAAE